MIVYLQWHNILLMIASPANNFVCIKQITMKQTSCKTFLAAAIFCAGLSVTACKSNSSDTNAMNNDTTTTYMEPQQDNTNVKPDTSMVMVSPDDSLTTMAKDAVKDYSGVTATVNDGEVTLTGDITREKLPKLMMAVQAMHPKKVNNNLTIK